MATEDLSYYIIHTLHMYNLWHMIHMYVYHSFFSGRTSAHAYHSELRDVKAAVQKKNQQLLGGAFSVSLRIVAARGPFGPLLVGSFRDSFGGTLSGSFWWGPFVPLLVGSFRAPWVNEPRCRVRLSLQPTPASCCISPRKMQATPGCDCILFSRATHCN